MTPEDEAVEAVAARVVADEPCEILCAYRREESCGCFRIIKRAISAYREWLVNSGGKIMSADEVEDERLQGMADAAEREYRSDD